MYNMSRTGARETLCYSFPTRPISHLHLFDVQIVLTTHKRSGWNSSIGMLVASPELVENLHLHLRRLVPHAPLAAVFLRRTASVPSYCSSGWCDCLWRCRRRGRLESSTLRGLARTESETAPPSCHHMYVCSALLYTIHWPIVVTTRRKWSFHPRRNVVALHMYCSLDRIR
jgi:hypothetical protein